MKAVKRSHSAPVNKTNCMGDEAFADLKEALEDALAFESGEQYDLRVTRIGSARFGRQAVVHHGKEQHGNS